MKTRSQYKDLGKYDWKAAAAEVARETGMPYEKALKIGREFIQPMVEDLIQFSDGVLPIDTFRGPALLAGYQDPPKHKRLFYRMIDGAVHLCLLE